MAVATNTFNTYTAKGIREALNDIVSRVSMEETPLQSNVGKESVSNTFYEHQTQELANVNLNNAFVEGSIAEYEAITPTIRVGNYTQILKKSFIISDTEEKVNKAGRQSEINMQKVLKGLEMRRDFEAILCSNQGASAGDGSTNPRKTGSLLAYIKSNVNMGVGGASPVYSNIPTATRTAGTARAFSEAQVKDILAKLWAAGAKTDMVMVNAVQKQRFSSFAGIAQLRTETSKKPATIVAAADIYIGDWGPVAITPQAFMRPEDALFIDSEYVSIATLRPYSCEEMARDSDARKFQCVQEVGLRVKNEKALGLITDLTNSLT